MAVPVTFLDSKTGPSAHRTVDVSRGGVFIQSDLPRAIRQLVRLRLEVPPVGTPVEVHGMVVHVVTPGEASERGGTPGMGVEFFGFGGNPRQLWEDFLRSVQSGTGPAYQSAPPPEVSAATIDDALPPVGSETFSTTPLPLGAPPPAAPAPAVPPQTYRPAQARPASGPRASAVCRVFPVLMPAVESLYDLYDNELATGSMFLCTPVQVPAGDRVVLRVIHPANQDTFDLHGIVVAVSTDPRYPGLTLELRPSTLARRDRFLEFANRGLPEEDLSGDLLDD